MEFKTGNKKRGMSVILIAATLSLSSFQNAADAWTLQPLPTMKVPCSRVPRLLMSTEDTEIDSKDDEAAKMEQIAKLEAELRQLKGEQKEEPAAPTTTVEEEDEEMLEEASMDMFLSEGWKEAREGYDPNNTATITRKNEEQGNLVGTVAKVVGAIVALVVFSQIPVGQEDLSKYSAIKSGPAKTTIDLGDTNRVKGQTLNANDFYNDASNTMPQEGEEASE